MDTLTELRVAVADLADVDQQRADLIARRDRLIVDALESGAKWAEVQAATGMGPRGVQLAVRRAKSV